MKDPRGKHSLPTYRIDLWVKGGDAIAETLAYVSDSDIAATVWWHYAQKHKGEEVTLRQGADVKRTTKPK